MEQPVFKRKKEDFICEVCGAPVAGNGYTNHCPRCLSSKHVDIHPGDRRATCGGIMRAAELEIRGGRQYILHQCARCSHARRNRVAPDDSFEALLALSNGTIEAYIRALPRL